MYLYAKDVAMEKCLTYFTWDICVCLLQILKAFLSIKGAHCYHAYGGESFTTVQKYICNTNIFRINCSENSKWENTPNIFGEMTPLYINISYPLSGIEYIQGQWKIILDGGYYNPSEFLHCDFGKING